MQWRREIIDPKEFHHPPFAYSPAVKFGSWVSMQMATDYKTGIVDEARRPYQSTDTGPQARVVLHQLSHLLETAGSSLQHQVKADNYYASRRHFGSREIRHKLMPVGAPPGYSLRSGPKRLRFLLASK